jgi:agmatine/peptidylarginine deiminase
MRWPVANLRPTFWLGFLGLAVLSACGGGGGGAVDELGQEALPISAPVLPNWATEEERLFQRTHPLPPPPPAPPPAAGFRMPAETEPTQAVVMTWAGYTTMLRQIAVAVADSGAEVWMIGGPSSISGVPAGQYRRLNLDFDSVWTRDYGPFGILEPDGGIGIVDPTYRHAASRPNDDAVPCGIAQELGAGCYQTGLVLDGGNFLTDGKGNVFMTRRTLDWNPGRSQAQVETLLRDYFGAQSVTWLDYAEDAYGEPADGTGHIDMFAKILKECVVLVAQADQSPFSAPLEAAATRFSGIECRPGETYQVIRIPGWSSWGVWYTYTNALIVNDAAIVPGYSGGDDDLARQIYQQALPGYTVTVVNSDDSITVGGSVHCVTREIRRENDGRCLAPGDCQLPNVATPTCVAGVCGIGACTAGYADCDGQALTGCETSLGTLQNCAACGDRCEFAHASAVCGANGCQMGACEPGFGDCAGGAADGCETPLGSLENCTACGDRCGFAHAAAVCGANGCQMGACEPGFGDCAGGAADGCETPLDTTGHCGSCTTACSAGETCVPEGGNWHCQTCVDQDGDGYSSEVCGGDDCNDADPSIHPGAADNCGDGIDRDCDGRAADPDTCFSPGGEDGNGCGCGVFYRPGSSQGGPASPAPGMGGLLCLVLALCALRRRGK